MPHANKPLHSDRRLLLIAAALCLALFGGGPAQASAGLADISQTASALALPGQDIAMDPQAQAKPPILLAKDKSDQLDVGDERPIGDQGIMRGKKDLFGKRRVEGPPDNTMLDLGIMVCGGALLVLVIFAFAYRPAPKAPQQDY